MFDLWEVYNELKFARIRYGNVVTQFRRISSRSQELDFDLGVAVADLKFEENDKKLKVTDRKLANLLARFSFIEHTPDLLFDMVSELSRGHSSFIQHGDYLGIINEKLGLEDSGIESIYLFRAGNVHAYGSRMKIDVMGSEYANRAILLQDPGDGATIDVVENPDSFLIREDNDPVRSGNGIMVYYDTVKLPQQGETRYTQRVFAISEGLMKAARALKTPMKD